jgi:hypothetical protein
MQKGRQDVKLERPDYLDNKVLIVDGLIGGGKGLMSAIAGSLPRVEMWIHKGNIEQLCAIQHLGEITSSGSETLLKSWFDEYFYNLSISRDINFRMSDMSSILKDARPLRYLARLFKSCGPDTYERVKSEEMVLNIMTHANTAYSEPIFNALGPRLVYVRLVRSPMTKYMINHMARWSKRWGEDPDGLIMHSLKSSPKDRVPFYMLGRESEFIKANFIEKAILLIDEWQHSGDEFIDNITSTSEATIIEIPFEKFVFEPLPYINKIAKALNTVPDKVTIKAMKKQNVPRKHLTSAPKTKTYIEQGWELDEKYNNIFDEFSATREIYKPEISSDFLEMLDQNTNDYNERYLSE